MPEVKIKQLQYEAETWKRLLGFIIDENVRQKNRLSEVLNEKFNEAMLEDVELFQYKFIKQDELISILRNEIVEFDELLLKEKTLDGIHLNHIEKKLHKLRNNINAAETQFSKLKSEFNNYLSDYL